MTRTVATRPLLAPWYRLVEDGDRLLLEYGQSVVALEGAAVRTLLPALLPLLDGTRTAADLVTRLGSAARPAVELALETLAENGLLVEGPAAAPAVQATANAFAASFDLAPATVAQRLSTATVGVVGGSPAGIEIARLLLLAGVGRVRQLSWTEAEAVDIAVVAPAVDELGLLEQWNDDALATETRWLAVRPFDGLFAAVGPLVIPGESCCYRCLLLRRAANLDYGADLPALEAAPVVATADPGFEALVVATATHLVLRWIAGHDTTLPGVLYALESRPALSITEHPVLRVPRCPACSPSERAAPPLPWHAAEAA